MASRDIANMHLFLDLKKKFPDLPDETLRSYIPLYAEDQEKCISRLQKESENHYHPSQQFTDFRLPDSKVNSMRNDYAKQFGGTTEGSFLPENVQYLDMLSFNKKLSVPSGRSSSHAGIVQLPGKSLSPNIVLKPDSFSAPVITSSEKPFSDLYKQNPISSHTTLCQVPNDGSNQIMIQTTKNHIIEAPMTHESTAYVSVSGEPEQPRRHAVRLSITPSFPFQQQYVNNPPCATASRFSRPYNHRTSLNFQLQPKSSDQLPLEISTIPTNIENPCSADDFRSHVQISVGPQGATFTAVRLQHPNYSQSQNMSHLPVINECPEAMLSSQVQNSNLFLFPNQRIQPLSNPGVSDNVQYPQAQGFDQTQMMYMSKNHPNDHVGPTRSLQSSPDFILAVKNHQIAQLELILSELEKEKSICSQLRAEVNSIEKKVTQGSAATTSFPYAEDLQKLREEVKNLRVEISCMYLETDSANQNEGFYPNIFTGPNDILATPSRGGSQVHIENLETNSNNKPSTEDYENDEKNTWVCKECTFKNHPALEKCEICELPKNLRSFFDDH